MKKIILIFVIANLFLNCEAKKEKAEIKKSEFYYPRVTDISENPRFEKIYLDSIENFRELKNLADQIACNQKSPLVIFETKQAKFHFQLYKECSKSNDIVDYSDSNVISIQKNIIIINDQILMPFDSLSTVLRNHILNPRREFNYSKSIDKALIFYYQKNSYSSEDIKNQLFRIATDFNELNLQNGDSLPLKVKLMDYPYIGILNPTLPEE